MPVMSDPLPLKDPVNSPELNFTLVAPEVPNMFPVPFTAVVVRLPEAPVTTPDDKPVTFTLANSAVDPDTITFFHVAII